MTQASDTTQEIISGLQASTPSISPKFFYDDIGSRLFEVITLLDEYYPSRTEKSIMEANSQAIALAVGQCDVLLDLGAGNCAKASALFDSIKPKQYRALDISKAFLESAVADLQKRFPMIEMQAQAFDLIQPLDFPDLINQRKTFFYPGSSIGNFDTESAKRFFENIAKVCQGAGGLLIGVDLIKDREVLHRAYNDSLGVTSAFNLNALLHINRLINANFDVRDWEHHAIFNESLSRIEMYLRAVRDVQVSWPSGKQSFQKGALIHTENSYKYTIANFTQMLLDAGFKSAQTWTDSNSHFLVCYASAQ